MKNKKLNTFKEYLKEQKMNESNVNIEVEWWDECIEEVLADLADFPDLITLSDFIQSKFQILGRAWDEILDNIYILHIKDLIFQYHGKSFCEDTTDNESLHVKGVVIENLAKVIFDKLCERFGGNACPDSTKIKVADCIPVPDQYLNNPDDICGDLDKNPFESRQVKKFEDYIKEQKKLNDTAQKISETYIKEEPARENSPKSQRIQQIEEFANNKGKREEIIKAWTELKDHPKAQDMKSEVGSAFDEGDLDEDMRSAFEAVGEGGIICDSFADSYWIRHKGQLIRVM